MADSSNDSPRNRKTSYNAKQEDTPSSSGVSGTPSPPKSPRNKASHQPFPERNTYDAMLCELSQQHFDWQCHGFQSSIPVLAFPVDRLNNRDADKPTKPTSLAVLHISLADSDSTLSPPNNQTGETSQVHSRSASTASLESKKTLKSQLSKSSTNQSASSPKKANKRKTANQVILGVYGVSGKSLIQLDLATVHNISSMSHEEDKTDTKLQIGRTAVVESESGTLDVTLPSVESKEKFIRVVKSVCAILLADSDFGMLCRLDLQNSKIFTTHNMICFHQGELTLGEKIVMSESAKSPKSSNEKRYCTYEFDMTSLYVAMIFQGRMLLFDDRAFSLPYKVLDLTRASVGSVSDPEFRVELPGHQDRKVFQIEVNGQSETERLVFMCFSEEERSKWIKAVSMAIKENHNEEENYAKSNEPDLTTSVIPVNQSLLDQKTFFEYVRMCIHPCEIVCNTELPGVSSWKEQFGDLPKVSKKTHERRNVESCFTQYHEFSDRVHRLLVHALLVCDDGALYQGDENIGFSYPGYENEMFRVGSLSVFRVWRLFRAAGRYMSFSLSGWDGTLGARSIGKELMQTLPEVQELYEFGKSNEAKEICATAAMDELQNLIIAQYLRVHRNEFSSNQILRVPWMTALDSQSRKKTTYDLLKYKEKDEYVLNPPVELLQDYLRGRLENYFSSSKIAIWSQLNWLEAMRLIHQERARLLELLDNALSLWFDNNGLQKSKVLMFFTRLQASIKDEKAALNQLLERLPSHEKLLDHYTIG